MSIAHSLFRFVSTLESAGQFSYNDISLGRLRQGEQFLTYEEVDEWVKSLSDECFYPVKVYSSLTVQKYNEKVSSYFIFHMKFC